VGIEIVVCGPDSPDLLRDLFAWLIEERYLAGGVRIVEREPLPFALGPVATALEVALGPGGSATALATVVVTWLRFRAGKVSVSLSVGEKLPRVEIAGANIKDLDAEALQALITQISDTLASLSAADMAESGGEQDA
jgi:hypothetical protein